MEFSRAPHRINTEKVFNAVVTTMNLVVTVIVTFETVVRFATFIKDWRPSKQKKMGFYKKRE